jgi:hypothetical protein
MVGHLVTLWPRPSPTRPPITGADRPPTASATSQLLPRTVEDWNTAWTTPDESMPHGPFAPTYMSRTHMSNRLGWPAVSVLCGFVDGLPVGLQIIGRAGAESTIFRIAQAYNELWGAPARPPVWPGVRPAPDMAIWRHPALVHDAAGDQRGDTRCGEGVEQVS